MSRATPENLLSKKASFSRKNWRFLPIVSSPTKSTSYAVAGTFGWPGALSKKPWQNEGFYLILTIALVASLALALLRFNPIQLIFWANVLAGVLAPVLVALILLVGNNRKIMRNQRLGVLTNIGLALALLILVAGAALLFYGLATGQGS